MPSLLKSKLTYVLLPALLLFFGLTVLFVQPLQKNRSEEFPGRATNSVPVPIERGDDGSFIRNGTFRMQSGWESIPDRVRLAFGTHGRSGVPFEASLRIGTCIFSASGSLNDNDKIFLERTDDKPSCETSASGEHQEFVLALQANDLERLAVWGTKRSPKAVRSAVAFQVERKVFLLGAAEYRAREGGEVSRAAAYAHLWGVSVGLIWLGVVLVSVALAAGRVLLVGAGSLAGVGVALLYLAAAMGYTLVTPPMQGPDEPDHVISFLKLTGQEERLSEITAYSGHVHHRRVAFQPQEKFTNFDLENSYLNGFDDHVVTSKVKRRSASTTAFWTVLGSLTKSWAIEHQFLALRLATILLIALLLAGTLTLQGHRFALVAVSIPFIPFLTSVVSTYSVAVALLIGALALLFEQRDFDSSGPRWRLIQVSLGVIVALLVFEARPLTLVLPVLFALMIANRFDRFSEQGAMQYWLPFLGAFTAVFVVLWWVFPNLIVQRLVIFTNVIGYKISIYQVLLVPLLLVALVLCVEGILRASHKVRTIEIPQKLIWSFWGVLSAVLLASLVVEMPNLPNIERPFKVKRADYIWDVLQMYATWFRIDNIDFFVHTSFLTGFGWLDTLPPKWFQGMLICLLFCAPVYIYRRVNRRTLGGGLVVIASILICIVSLTVAAHRVRYNLHGRYFVGLNFMLLTALSIYRPQIPQFVRRQDFGRYKDVAVGCLPILFAGLHLFCFATIVWRHF